MRLVTAFEDGGVTLRVSASSIDDTARHVAQALGIGLYRHLSRDEPGYTSFDTSAVAPLLKASQAKLPLTPQTLATLGWVARTPRFGSSVDGGLWADHSVAIGVPEAQGGGGNGPCLPIRHCEIHINPMPADLPDVLHRLRQVGVAIESVTQVSSHSAV